MEKNRNNSSSTSPQQQPPWNNSIPAAAAASSHSFGYRNTKYSASSSQQQQKRNQSYPQQQQQSNQSYPQQQLQQHSNYSYPHSNRSYPQQQQQSATDNKEDDKIRMENRAKRFGNAHVSRAENNYSRPRAVGARTSSKRNDYEGGNNAVVGEIDVDSFVVKGTCQQVEKGYLRLTSAPDPASVRPEQVLEKALFMVQKSQKNYLYKCDQLKSIRQDLTVQRIRNELTVKVYETHARLAIEAGDLSEYNQCLSQLQELYAEGNKGCDMEFSAYNLLYVILHSNSNMDLLSAMSRLSVNARKDEAVKHALAVRAAVTSGNYVLFFKLYKEAPNLSTFLMDLYVEKMRYTAVKCISRSYRPTLPVAYIAQILGFSSLLLADESNDEKDSDELKKCVEWLKAHGACLLVDNTGKMLLDSKASTSSLFMPKPEVDVAHGDATLSVNDFLTRAPS